MKKSILIFSFFFITIAGFSKDKNFYFTTSDSVRLYVRIAGQGKPCLFVHGGPGLTSYYFEALPAAKLLQQKLMMIYFDQRGSGRSATPKSGNYSVKRVEKDMDELRAFLHINRWAVMGHSFGGLSMTAYAKDYPQHISSLLYIHCGWDLKTILNSHITNGVRLLKKIGDTITVNKKLSLFDQMMQVHAELAKQKIEYKIMHPSQRENDISDSLTFKTIKNFNYDYANHVWKLDDYWVDFTTYTKNIKIPALIIAGTKDYATGPTSYKALHFPHMQVVLYNGGHYSFQEQPTWFANKVFAFLKQYPIR